MYRMNCGPVRCRAEEKVSIPSFKVELLLHFCEIQIPFNLCLKMYKEYWEEPVSGEKFFSVQVSANTSETFCMASCSFGKVRSFEHMMTNIFQRG